MKDRKIYDQKKPEDIAGVKPPTFVKNVRSSPLKLLAPSGYPSVMDVVPGFEVVKPLDQ